MTKFTLADLNKLGYSLDGDKAVKTARANPITTEEPKKNKFGAEKTYYRGEAYDSKKEAQFHARLDLQRGISEPSQKVVGVARQVPYKIVINGILVCTYYLDFLITYADNRRRYVDIKGLKKGAAYQIFRLKKKMVEAMYGIEIEEV